MQYPPSLAVSMLVNRLKGVSSRGLRQQYPTQVRKYLRGKHFWSPSCFAASCGGAPLTIIKQYIEQQTVPTDQQAARSAGRTNGIGVLPAVNGQASPEEGR